MLNHLLFIYRIVVVYTVLNAITSEVTNSIRAKLRVNLLFYLFKAE